MANNEKNSTKNAQNAQGNSPKKKNGKKNGKRNLVILILMFLLLICLFVVQCQLNKVKQQALEEQKLSELALRQQQILDSLRAEQAKADSLKALEEARIADSLRIADSIRTADSLANLPKVPAVNKDSIRAYRKFRRDSIARVNDSLARIEKDRQDSLNKARFADSLRNSDKVPPTAEITPPAGRYYDPIKLKVKCDEIKCKTFVSIGDTLNPQDASKGIEYNKTGSVFFYAADSVGNRSAWEEAPRPSWWKDCLRRCLRISEPAGRYAEGHGKPGRSSTHLQERRQAPLHYRRMASSLPRQGRFQVLLRLWLQAEQVQHQHEGRQEKWPQGSVPQLVWHVRHERKSLGMDSLYKQAAPGQVPRRRRCMEYQQRK